VQIGAIVAQKTSDARTGGPDKFKPVAFFAAKMTPAQRRYTVTEQELLSIVMTLKRYKSMVFGYPVNIYTDHKNLTFSGLQADRTIRWRLYVEEFGPTFYYIKGETNTGADALSRLDMVNAEEATIEEIEEVYAMTEEILCPITYNIIADAQMKEFPIILRRDWQTKKFGDYLLYVTPKNLIRVPTSLRSPIIEWYHNMLMHPGVQRMEETLKMHFAWPGLTEDVHKFVQACPECQCFKHQRKQYGKVPTQEPVITPWEVVAVDLTGPWTVPSNNQSRNRGGNRGGNRGDNSNRTSDETAVTLMCLTIIDIATQWVEIVRIPSKDAVVVAKKFDQVWLSRYPRPLRCIHDQGSEFTGFEFQELLDSYGIRSSPTTVQNPTANGVLERVHQTMSNMLRTANLQTIDFTTAPETLDKLLASVAFALRATYHTSMQASPAQMVFGRDMIFPTTYVANWHHQRNNQVQRMQRDAARENTNRIDHRYSVGDLVLIRRDRGGEVLGRLARPTHGPFRVIQVFPNGTVIIDRIRFHERINVRRLIPYHARP
jgi:transposase InsO family protein